LKLLPKPNQITKTKRPLNAF